MVKKPVTNFHLQVKLVIKAKNSVEKVNSEEREPQNFRNFGSIKFGRMGIDHTFMYEYVCVEIDTLNA